MSSLIINPKVKPNKRTIYTLIFDHTGLNLGEYCVEVWKPDSEDFYMTRPLQRDIDSAIERFKIKNPSLPIPKSLRKEGVAKKIVLSKEEVLNNFIIDKSLL